MGKLSATNVGAEKQTLTKCNVSSEHSITTIAKSILQTHFHSRTIGLTNSINEIRP